MEIQKPKTGKKTKTKKHRNLRSDDNVESDTETTEPISNLSASVDITGELLSAAFETINEPFNDNELKIDVAGNADKEQHPSEDNCKSIIKEQQIIKELDEGEFQNTKTEVEDLGESGLSEQLNEVAIAPTTALSNNKELSANLLENTIMTDIMEQFQNVSIMDSHSQIEHKENNNVKERLEKHDESTVTNSKLIYPIIKTEIPEKREPIPKLGIKAYTEQQLAALYLNEELHALEQFTHQFVEAELKGLTIKQHPLYDLLINYLNSRSKIVGNNLEIEQLRKEYSETHNVLWNIEKSVASARGECQDGNTVLATHSYTKATFQRNMFQTIARTLASIRLLSNESHTLHSYSADVLRLQIDSYINTLTLNCIHHASLPKDAPVLLNFQNISPYLNQYLCDLRLCISVLFSFQRKLLRDTIFIKETREWLSQLVAVLLRIANWQDHLFIINHILRCPAGVGNWAASFIQAPLNIRHSESPFSNREINHIVTVLLLLLMPIDHRYQFLKDLSQTTDSNTEKWIVVDSDGEEDDDMQGGYLRENDLVAFFNQLPLDNLFKVLLCIEQKNNLDYYNKDAISEYHILKFFAFSTTLLKILHKGLLNYNQPRYNQFSKRLSRLIRHIVQYATDQWELFKTNEFIEDVAMLKRLQVEYDAFFLRATYYLYISQKMGAWQFLAIVPYNHVSIKTLWKIYYLLHDLDNAPEVILDPIDETDYENKLWESYVRLQFQEKLINLTDDECYYLLNTFANMALARTEDDLNFIKSTIKDLMEIGYICEATQEMCCKNARILLTHITSKYNYLLSDILQLVKDNIFTIASLGVHLYEELPLSVWFLTDNDFNIISKWLLQNTVTSNESCLARMIISRLNWDITNEGNLFLPYELHCKVALLVAEVIQLDPLYNSWGWQTIFRLKLHLNDKGVTDLEKIKEPEYYNIIVKGIREKQLLPCFLSTLMTTWGHLVPLVCSHGLKQLIFLETNQKYDAVIFGLYLLVPLFIECQEPLINSEPFQNILIGLLSADRTYINMAKSIMGPQNTILEHFGYMIEHQITNYWWYSLQSPRCLVRLWINSLVSIPQWNKDVGVMYLLDIIIRASFFYTDARDVVNNILKDLLQCTTPQEHSNSISSLFKWVSQSNSQNVLLINGSLSTCTYLAYILIELEFEEREKQTGLWNETLTQLMNQKGKVNVDAAIKKAANVLKVPSFTSAHLSLFRWAQQGLDTPIDHPLLPLLWQKFFSLYLCRVPMSRGIDQGCVGSKFFEGLINLTFLKKIKKHLQEAVDYFAMKIEEFRESESITFHFYTHCHKLFQAYSLWLEETRLQEPNMYLPNLPAQYQPNLLALILEGSTASWMEYVHSESIESEQQKAMKIFKCLNFREKHNVNLPLLNVCSTNESADPLVRMLRRLNSYDAPKSAPGLNQTNLKIPYISFNDSNSLFKALKPYFDTLIQFAKNYNLKVSELNALDCMYLELVPQQYRSVLHKVKKQVPCNRPNKTVHCSGPANILLQMQEARINERIDHQIQINRNDYESLLSKLLQAPANSLCIASVILQHTVDTLQKQQHINPDFCKLGVELFYYILPLLNEELTNFLPTKQLFTACLEKLGQAHICGVEFETPKLLEKILQESSLSEYLAPHFSPDNVQTENFLLMYSNISKDIGQKYDMIFALLSKFDVTKWLNTKQPKLKQRSKFIELVIKSLTKLGCEPPNDSLILHEVYRKHLLNIFEYQFPEHVGEILTHMLKVSNGGTDTGSIAICVWMDLLNYLSTPIHLNFNKLSRDQLRLYAQQQKLLHYQELLEMNDMLSRHFQQERLQYGLYGLYPKIRNYIDVFVLLLGMTGHALIISSLNTHQGLLGEKLCEIIWPNLRELFAPWLIPYWIQNLKENMANWIQQLADDRTVLLPWIAADGPYAQKIVHMFFECIHFIIQTLPGCNKILSFVWHWYVTNYAHLTIKDYISNVIHVSFLGLPWKNFWPTVSDLEMMLKVIEQYLPESHIFLGCIFMEISWSSWLKAISDGTPIHIKTKIQHCLLHLIVKLSNEPNIRNNHSDKAKALLIEAEIFNWNFIEVDTYQQVMDWYVMSCDQSVIFKTDPLNLDCKILRLLQIVGYYDRLIDYKSSNQLKKRHIFVRSYIKLLVVFTSKYKSLINSKEFELNNIITYQLNYMEQIVENDDEFKILLSEIFEILNQSMINKMVVKCFEQWISSKPSHGLVIKTILHTLGVTVCDTGIAAILFEATINSYFNNNITHQYLWSDIVNELNLFLPKQSELEQSLLVKGSILTLHAILLKKIEKRNDLKTLLNTSIEWLSAIKVSENIETKIPLIWSDILTLSLQFCEIDESCAGAFLYKFSQILMQYADEMEVPRWGRGLLGVIGIGKQSTVSLQFKFLCRALAGYILAQLPEMKGNPQTVRKVANASSIVGHTGGNAECAKILLKLDFGQSQGQIKDCAELALKQIQEPANSLHNANEFLALLLNQMYMKPYLKDIG